jgi:16S rRNA processing protein RimM
MTSSSTSSTDPAAAGAEPSPAPSRLEVGFVAKAHGLQGHVIVELVSNRAERVELGAVLFTAAGRPLESAERLRATTLYGEPIADPDVLWVHELLGALVVDQTGTTIGTVVAVEANPASDLLVLDGGALVPLRFVTARDQGVLTVDVPDGLLDL